MERSFTGRLLTRRAFVAGSGLASGSFFFTTRIGAAPLPSSSAALALVPDQAQAGTASDAQITIGMNNEPNTLDPHLAIGRHTETFLVNIYDSLVKTAPDGQFVPGLAESWEQINPTTWQFKSSSGRTIP